MHVSLRRSKFSMERFAKFSNWLGALLSVLVSLLLSSSSSHSALVLSQEELINEAKKEGRLVFYASGTTEQTTMFLDTFNQKDYPFIKTEYFRTGKTALLNRVLKENQAKKIIADAIQSSVIELNLAKRGGALGKYIAHEAKDYADQIL